MNVIAITAKDRGIGLGGGLLFRVPEDMARFRDLTLGKVVVMGRETFLSLPGMKPLKGRANIVLSRNPDFTADGCVVCRSAGELFAELSRYDGGDVFIIGGQSVYEELLPFCDRAYITVVDSTVPADRFFPDIASMKGWRLKKSSETYKSNGLSYKFLEYAKEL